MEMLCERSNATKDKSKGAADSETEDDVVAREEAAEEQKLKDEEENLVVLLEQRVQFILLSLTKLFLSKSPGSNKKEYVALKLHTRAKRASAARVANDVSRRIHPDLTCSFSSHFQRRDSRQPVQTMLRAHVASGRDVRVRPGEAHDATSTRTRRYVTASGTNLINVPNSRCVQLIR